jgi:hypothetical protein
VRQARECAANEETVTDLLQRHFHASNCASPHLREGALAQHASPDLMRDKGPAMPLQEEDSRVKCHLMAPLAPCHGLAVAFTSCPMTSTDRSSMSL